MCQDVQEGSVSGQIALMMGLSHLSDGCCVLKYIGQNRQAKDHPRPSKREHSGKPLLHHLLIYNRISLQKRVTPMYKCQIQRRMVQLRRDQYLVEGPGWALFCSVFENSLYSVNSWG